MVKQVVCEQQAIGDMDSAELSGIEPLVGLPAERPEGQEEKNAAEAPRLDRIVAYERAALAKDDPFESVIEASTAGLLRIEVLFQEAVERAMRVAPLTAERIRILSGSCELHLKYARQIDRFSQLVRKQVPRPRGNGPTAETSVAEFENRPS